VTRAEDPPRAPGLWVPFAVLGLLVPIVTFVGAYIGAFRVIDRHLTEIDARLDRIDRLEDDAATDRRDFAVHLGRLEAAVGVDRRGRP
jgi:hypothetical protein